MNKYVFIVVALFVLGCNNESATTPADQTKQTNGRNDSLSTALPDISGCYLRVTGRDSLVASLQQQGQHISGKLSFDNYEKDGSSGTVDGFIKDSIIKLVYSYYSEGMHSVMDVYFKIEENGLIQGAGEMKNKGDTLYFEKPDAVQYTGTTRLNKLPCTALAAKYK
jgi:hypothetical protein